MPLSAFREVWAVDFEFNGPDGALKHPVCMAARELHTGREICLWREELHKLRCAPFDVGPSSLFVAYMASAEFSCFLPLGWKMPVNVLDLYAEHRVQTNGLILPTDNGLLGACALRGIPTITSARKEAMRDVVIRQDTWSASEQQEILGYCAEDVAVTTKLLGKMVDKIDMPRALLRGRYTGAVAHMEYTGIPVDLPLLDKLREGWEGLKVSLIRDVDADFGVYEGTSFRAKLFAEWLRRNRIPWPTFADGTLLLDNDTFKDQAKTYPAVNALHELRSTVGKMRLSGLHVGRDGRNRCMLSPFQSSTGRNQPSNAKFLFGPAVWMRGLMRPPEGYGIAYIDFAAQEIAIAAGLSGDERMIADYLSGDPHWAFAVAAGLVPAGATRKTHPHLEAVRERCKTVNLGVLFGMEARSAALRLGIPLVEAAELLQAHRRTYRRFWEWSDHTVGSAMLSDRIRATFGWTMAIREVEKKRRQSLATESRRNPERQPLSSLPRKLANWPMQSNGAEMMRLAAIAATEAGIEVCCPVHDAFVIQAPLDRLDRDVARMQAIMTRAGEIVTGGVPVRADAVVVRWPDRYMDKRGTEMWGRVMRLLGEADTFPLVQGHLPTGGNLPPTHGVTRYI